MNGAISIKNTTVKRILKLAAAEASKYRGATDPNPPVGAVATDSFGNILAIDAHRCAGEAHAEELVLNQCKEKGLLDKLAALFITLQPCNHKGRRGPCTELILKAGVKEVFIGALDPNSVAGDGIQLLRENGINVHLFDDHKECLALIKPFSKWIKTKRPYVTVKRALQENGSMIPPKGQKTFTSASSLKLAHQLRKKSRAIITGSGTVLIDNPLFTVRHVNDHEETFRYLILLDRRKRVSSNWIKEAKKRNLEVIRSNSLGSALDFLGEKGILEVLVEAGPLVSAYVLESQEWDEEVVITKGNPDLVEYRFRTEDD